MLHYLSELKNRGDLLSISLFSLFGVLKLEINQDFSIEPLQQRKRVIRSDY